MSTDSGKLTRRGFVSAAGTGAGALIAASARIDSRKPAEYPLIRAAGSHRELGRQHGEQASEKIKAHLAIMTGTSECPANNCGAARSPSNLFSRSIAHTSWTRCEDLRREPASPSPTRWRSIFAVRSGTRPGRAAPPTSLAQRYGSPRHPGRPEQRHDRGDPAAWLNICCT